MNTANIPVEFAALQRYVPFVIGFIVIVVIFELMKIPKRLKAKAAFSHLTGRAMATITDYHKERILRAESTDPESSDSYEYRTIIRYQFEVDGRIYTGEGEGNGAFWQRDKQMICYDPNDPDENCTLFFLNSQTKSHFFKTLIFCVIMLLVFYFAVAGFGKLGK